LTSLDDLTILLSPVRDGTAAAVFDAVFQHHKVASAGCTQCIERAIAKETVERRLVHACMTGKVFAFPITEKGIVLIHPFRRLIYHVYPLLFGKYSTFPLFCKQILQQKKEATGSTRGLFL
jgi:hypothetical protein